MSDPNSDLTTDPTPTPTPPAAPAPAPITYSAPPVRPAKKQNRSGTVLLAVAGLVAVAGVAFAGGRLTAPPAAAADGTTRTGNFPFGSFTPGGGFRGGGGNFPGGGGGALGLARSIDVRGQVTAVTADSITIQTDAGTDVTLPINSSTTYHSATAATSSSVTVGSTVVIEPSTGTAPGQSFAPGAIPSVAPGASPGQFGGFNLGPATDVTVIQP